jgi:hypothetical protein
MDRGAIRQRGNTQETCPTLTGKRNTSREMDAQQSTRGYGGIWPAAHLRKLPVPHPHPLGDAYKAVARTVAPTRIPRAGRTRNSLASQSRQVDQGRRDQSQSQIQPEPTTRHRVTSVFALIAVVSSLCRHLPSAPAGRSAQDRSHHPGARRSKAKRSSFLVRKRRWLSCGRSAPEATPAPCELTPMPIRA